ncbi:MAG: tol-pal system protein YbgF [Pseudomonadota bacterium]
MGGEPSSRDRRDCHELMTRMGLSRRRAISLRDIKAVLPMALALVGLALTPGSSIAAPVVLQKNPLGARAVMPSGLQQIQAQQDPAARAREQAYIGRLEEQIRRLTGRIEQLEYDQRNTNGRIDQLIEDLDQRLRAFEQSGGNPSNVAEDGTASAPSNELGQAEQALNDLATAAADQNAAPGDGSLGSVPESALANLPRPNPADVAAPEKSTLTPEQQYENAVQLLQAGDYQGAQGGLELFLDLNADHQLASNAAYWLAETHYVRQNFSAAAAAFARNYRSYGSDSAKAIDNLLKLGMSLSNLGEQEKACLTYDELNNAFPKRPAHIQQALSRERARAQCG